ncbi:hypothetical protein RvY_08248 [Ramazzottius varieornatus]|uniref:Uncharacterized protein n=1 Tax=Ramazzottius varieornatus TaxID=947166 RepID=A0A1D1V563_RAMVA|nr:hypothetical protein RvY_08248 [Ramazzottius varieornatus]
MADKLARGLPGELVKLVTVLNPKTPAEFKQITARVIEAEKKTSQQTRIFREQQMPNDIADPMPHRTAQVVQTRVYTPERQNNGTWYNGNINRSYNYRGAFNGQASFRGGYRNQSNRGYQSYNYYNRYQNSFNRNDNGFQNNGFNRSNSSYNGGYNNRNRDTNIPDAETTVPRGGHNRNSTDTTG